MKQLGSNHTFLFMHCACFYSAELTAVTEERTITRSTHQYNSLKSTSYKKLSDSQIHQNKGSQCKNVIKKSETAAIFVVSTLTILQIMIVMIKNRSPSTPPQKKKVYPYICDGLGIPSHCEILNCMYISPNQPVTHQQSTALIMQI